MDIENLNDLLKDEDFMKKVLQSNSTEDFKVMFKNKGINLSDKDVKEIINLIRYEIKGPIKEFQMENVIGGEITSAAVRDIAFAISSLMIAGSVGYLSFRASQTLQKADKTMDKLDCLKPRYLGSLFMGFDSKDKEDSKK